MTLLRIVNIFLFQLLYCSFFPCYYVTGHKEEYLKQMNIKAILDFFIKTEVFITLIIVTLQRSDNECIYLMWNQLDY